MSFAVTLLSNDEKFCTLVDGELAFWMIEDGVPVRVPNEQVDTRDNWTLVIEEKV